MPAHPLPRGAMYNLNVPALPYDRLKGIAPATLAPVFLDEPDYDPTEDGGWLLSQGRAAPLTTRGVRDEAGQGYCHLTKLTWDFRLNAPDDELNDIKL